MIEKLRKSDRRARILDELRHFPHVRITNLAEKFDVTTETIRRDLDALSKEGLVDRAHGGASARPMGVQPPVGERRQEHVHERTRIGAAAASLVASGEVVMVDAGSTTAHFGRHLAYRDIDATVITNSYPVAGEVSADCVRIVMCPGEYDPKEGSVYGGDAVDFLKRFHANKAFIGASGLSAEGFSDINRDAVWIKRTMMQRAEEAWLLVDSGKFDLKLFEVVAPLDALTGIVSDQAPTGSLKDAIDRAGLTLHVASQDETAS